MFVFIVDPRHLLTVVLFDATTPKRRVAHQEREVLSPADCEVHPMKVANEVPGVDTLLCGGVCGRKVDDDNILLYTLEAVDGADEGIAVLVVEGEDLWNLLHFELVHQYTIDALAVVHSVA